MNASVSCEPMMGMSWRAAQQVRDGADVVLVAVGEHDRLDVVEAVLEVAEVGQDQVHARLVVLGEEHAAVDDEQAAVVLEHVHVAANLAEAAERNEAQGAGLERGRAEAIRGESALLLLNG